jgi:hypothetical protein
MARQHSGHVSASSVWVPAFAPNDVVRAKWAT